MENDTGAFVEVGNQFGGNYSSVVPSTPYYQMVIWWKAAKVVVGTEHSESIFKINVL